MQGWTRKLELRCFRCPNPVWLPTCILSSHTWPRSEFANCFAQLRRIICEVAPRRKFALNFLAALLGPPRVSPGCSSCPLSSLSTINSSRLLHARELRCQLGFIWRTPHPPLCLLLSIAAGQQVRIITASETTPASKLPQRSRSTSDIIITTFTTRVYLASKARNL